MDFRINTYKDLLQALLASGYSFQTLEEFITNPLEKVVILRHDVDRLPGNALKMARLEQEMGIMATYYFRFVPASWDEEVMQDIAGLGHEVGYHYENVDSVRKNVIGPRNTRISAKGEQEKLIDLAYENFCWNLEKFRERFDIKTICMHGSPLSRYDNRMIWEKYDYRDLGIIGEPYFDVDFSQVFYLTDTGRKWNHEVSVRDNVKSGFDIEIKNTEHLIELVKRSKEKSFVHESARMNTNEETKHISSADRRRNGLIASGESRRLPDKIMLNVHPQRWNDRPWPWVKELVGQNVKNVVKAALIKIR